MRFSKSEMTSLLEESGEIPENKTIHIHHCKEGNNNDRCYITNKGTVTLFYCHHCGSKGILKNQLATVKSKLNPVKQQLPYGFDMPYDCVEADKQWPIDAIMWLVKGHIDTSLALSKGIKYSPKLNRVCVPIVFQGEYQGYIARRIGEEGPKYLARKKTDDRFLYILHHSEDSIVIVEDILSAIRINSLGYSVAALQGTELTDEMLSAILNFNYSNFIIWLDNDNPTVKGKQAKLKSRLKMYGTTKLIKTDIDPKELSNDDINRAINNS